MADDLIIFGFMAFVLGALVFAFYREMKKLIRFNQKSGTKPCCEPEKKEETAQ